METTALISFVRFVVCGGGVGLLSGGALFLLTGPLPFAAANALVSVVSTLLATELHSRFTFGAGRRAGLRVHLQSGATLAVAYAVTTGAMLLLHAAMPGAGPWVRQAVYLGASGLAGIGRFVVLRTVVHARDWKIPTVPEGVLRGFTGGTPA
jgi:putative flippase GtrA